MAVSKQFVLAGNATFTIELPVTASGYIKGEFRRSHYTFRVRKTEANENYPEAYFVKVLTGPDNESNYTYLGKLSPLSGAVVLTGKSKFTADSFPVRLLERTLSRVWADDHAAYEAHGYKTHHEGACGRCGRKLTVPASVESGIGPECAKLLQPRPF